MHFEQRIEILKKTKIEKKITNPKYEIIKWQLADRDIRLTKKRSLPPTEFFSFTFSGATIITTSQIAFCFATHLIKVVRLHSSQAQVSF